MKLHRLSTLTLRALLVGMASLAVVSATSLFDEAAPEAEADPAFGTVRVWPPTGQIILEGYIFNVPVNVTTCPETGGVSGTASGGSLTTMTVGGSPWTTNQWAGWDVMLKSGPSSPQTRTVVSNTSNTLTVSETWGDTLDSGTATGGSDTTVVDAGSGWTPNEFAGKTLEITSPGGPMTTTITSNTADTLTVPAYTTHVGNNPATAGSTATTLVDTGAAFGTSQYVNKVVQLNSGSAAGQTRRIISHTNTALTIEGTWETASGGTATAATSTTLTDATKSWTPNAFAGMNVEMLSGAASGQSKVITSNTATQITISGTWSVTPAFGDFYRVIKLPDATTNYSIRDGAADGSTYAIKQLANPTGTTGYQLFKSACRPAGYEVTVTYNEDKFTPVFEGGVSTGGNTATTLKDTNQSWKINQWAGSRVNISGGTGFGQWRIVTSNTADTLTVANPWVTTPVNGSVYQIGGIADGGFVASPVELGAQCSNATDDDGDGSVNDGCIAVGAAESGTGPCGNGVDDDADTVVNDGCPPVQRTVSCPIGGQYFSGSVELHCVTFGGAGTGLPLPPTGVGNLVTVVFHADGGRGIYTFGLTTNLLEVDGSTIPADVFQGARRVILCPDSNTSGSGNGRINSGDQLFMAQAYGQGNGIPPNPGGPLYTITKDPSEDGKINSQDQLLLAAVFNQFCVQP